MAAMTNEALQTLLDELRTKHNVVGATLGVLQNGNIAAAASGLLNLDTGVECTPDSVFQIGSIGKVFTTSLVMQLVDEGRLSLDDKVTKHLRDFQLADMRAARSMTLRQLLTHTSGMDGDFFAPDDPEGPSTLSYIRKLNLLPSLYPPGEGPMTYCNSGFVTAGRIVEVLTGMPWQIAVMERICKPLGLKHVFAHPHEALRYRCAMGHIADPKDATKIHTAPATFLSLSAAPAGSVLSMSVESVLRFAQAHMADGAYGEDKTLLSAASARRMRDETIAIPAFSRTGVNRWGLGWFACEGAGYKMVGHDGGTLGQFTYMRTFPELKAAFALFTNSPSNKLFDDIEAQLMQHLVGKPVAADPPRTDWTPDLARYTGRYGNIASTYTLEDNNGTLGIQIASKLSFGAPDAGATLEPYCEEVFVLKAEGTPFDGQKISFLENDNGRARYLRGGLRMAPRL